MRQKHIRRAILEALKPAGTYALLGDVLRSHVKDLIRPEPTTAEWQAAMQWLEDNGYIVASEPEIDEELREYLVTERGKNLLRTL